MLWRKEVLPRDRSAEQARHRGFPALGFLLLLLLLLAHCGGEVADLQRRSCERACFP